MGSAAPLPVALASFGARRLSASTALVSWATATELACNRFEVERSADGQQFGRVGEVACGTSTQLRTYSFRDELAAGAAYYRLRQVDAGGQATYSPVAYVGASAEGSPLLSVFPNPTTSTVTLLGAPGATSLTFSLTNALGQLVLPASPATLAAANEALNTALGHCPPGVYVLTATLNGQPQHLKVIKQ